MICVNNSINNEDYECCSHNLKSLSLSLYIMLVVSMLMLLRTFNSLSELYPVISSSVYVCLLLYRTLIKHDLNTTAKTGIADYTKINKSIKYLKVVYILVTVFTLLYITFYMFK